MMTKTMAAYAGGLKSDQNKTSTTNKRKIIMQFQKASRMKSKLRLALTGASGSGKTYSALLIAKGMGGRCAVIDTERGSAALYSHIHEFDALELTAPYTPERFIEALKSAESAGYDVLIIDSITHEWNGVGGCLELVDVLAAAKFRGNGWAAFSEVTPRHRLFIDALLQSNLHIIATMRSKTETVQSEDRKKILKLGMKSEQRDGTDYEFTTVLDIVHDGHAAIASKDRTGLFGGDPKVLTEKTGEMLVEWLNSGVDAPPVASKVLLPQETLADHLANIESASDHESLKNAFVAAVADAKKFDDAEALDSIVNAKDTRKAEIAERAAA